MNKSFIKKFGQNFNFSVFERKKFLPKLFKMKSVEFPENKWNGTQLYKKGEQFHGLI